MFTLPCKGTVKTCSITIGDSRKRLETCVLPTGDITELKQTTLVRTTLPRQESWDSYIPHLFRAPVLRIHRNEQIEVEVNFIEPLSFADGKYTFRMPMSISPHCLPTKKPIQELIMAEATIYNFGPALDFSSENYTLRTTKDVGQFGATLIPNGDRSRDIDFSYHLISKSIMGSFILQPGGPLGLGDGEGSFCLFVTPPEVKYVNTSFTRHIVFILDRSGSMTGEPFENMVSGVNEVLQTLSANEMFTIAAFDDRSQIWNQELQMIDDNTRENAVNWLRATPPGNGGTNFSEPLKWALDLLGKGFNPRSSIVPVIIFVTDGCVADEKAICRYAQANAKYVRVFSLGIGNYCNEFFLRELSEITRGFSLVAHFPEEIGSRIAQLLKFATRPLMANVSVTMPGVDSCDISPYPIPDLYVGSPLLVSGQYITSGKKPQKVTVRGTLFNGKNVAMEVPISQRANVPVDLVFMKQRLDLLTSRAWLQEQKELELQCIEFSVLQSIPCNLTRMVMVEVGDSHVKRFYEERPRDLSSLKKMMKSNGQCTVVGASINHNGNIAASLGNLPIAWGAGLTAIFMQTPLCYCYGCNCGSCGPLDVCVRPMCDCFGGCCGGCFSFLQSGTGDACGCLLGCCAGLFGNVGHCARSCFDECIKNCIPGCD